MHKSVNAIAILPPEESPVNIIFFGLIPNFLFQ